MAAQKGWFVDFINVEKKVVERKFFGQYEQKAYNDFVKECKENGTLRYYSERYS